MYLRGSGAAERDVSLHYPRLGAGSSGQEGLRGPLSRGGTRSRYTGTVLHHIASHSIPDFTLALVGVCEQAFPAVAEDRTSAATSSSSESTQPALAYRDIMR